MPLVTRLYAAFSAAAFGGNIAGVVYDETGLGDAEMQGIAADLCAPTTGFVRQVEDKAFQVRFFSTRSEMAMCGHVTVGIFAALFDDKRIGAGEDAFRQITPAGELRVSVSETDAGPLVSMQQLAPRFDLVAAETTEIAPLLGLPDEAIRLFGSAGTALRHLFVELADEAALDRIKPNDAGLRALAQDREFDTLGIWCAQSEENQPYRLRLRDLCHGVGDPEEAASGTTNGALACHLWHQNRISAGPDGLILVDAEQGFEMGRPSRIATRLIQRAGEIVQVRVGGTATKKLEGVYG